MITLLTDFGTDDSYVASMKGQILRRVNTTIVDIVHTIIPQNITQASFILSQCYMDFPEKTVHTIVVDPGVGSKRKAIAVKTDRYFFVAPDNGVLSFALMNENILEVVEIDTEGFAKTGNISNTFHGRDIFAPAAAHIEKNKTLDNIGDRIDKESIVRIDFPKPVFLDDRVRVFILHVDRFGNVITSLHKSSLAKNWTIDGISVKICDKYIYLPYKRFYSEVEPGNLLSLVGSSGFIEFSLNQGNFAEKYGIVAGKWLECIMHCSHVNS